MRIAEVASVTRTLDCVVSADGFYHGRKNYDDNDESLRNHMFGASRFSLTVSAERERLRLPTTIILRSVTTAFSM